MLNFLSLKTSISAIRERHADLCRQIQATKAEITSVHSALPSRGDIVASIDEWIKHSAQGFDEAVVASVTKGLYNGAITRGNFKVGFLELHTPKEFEATSVPNMNSALFKVFGHEIRNHIVSAVENMEWPSDLGKPGLPKAEREKKLAELAQKETNLRTELEKIVKDAVDAGIDL